jgi:hypothetical protein
MPLVPGGQQAQSDDEWLDGVQRGVRTPQARSGDDIWLEKIERSRIRRVNLALGEGETFSMDRAVRALRVESETGAPAALIRNNLEFFEKRVSKGNASREEILKTKVFHKWIQKSAQYGKMGLEDIANLPNLDYLFETPKGLWRLTKEQKERMADRTATRQTNQFMSNPGNLGLAGLGFGEDFEAAIDSEWRRIHKLRMDSAMADLEFEDDFIADTGKVGFWESIEKKWRGNPAFIIPFVRDVGDIKSLAELYGAALDVEKGTANQEQIDLLTRYGRMDAAMARRGQGFAGITAEIMGESLPMILEFWATSGAYSGAKAAVLKGGKEMAEATLKSAIRKTLKRGVGREVTARLAGVTAQTFTGGALRIAEGTLRRMTPAIQTDIKDKEFVPIVIHGKNSWVTSFRKAVVDDWAEMFSERVGGTAFFRALSKKSNNILFQWWRKGQETITENAFQKALQKGGINGLFAEVSEERIGDLIRMLGGSEPMQLSNLFPEFLGGTLSNEQLAAEFVTFGAMMSPGLVARFADPRVVKVSSPEHTAEILKHRQDSVLAQNNPPAFKDYVEEATQDTDYQFSWIKKGDFVEKFEGFTTEAGEKLTAKQVFVQMGGKAEDFDRLSDTEVAMVTTAGWLSHEASADKANNTFFQDEVTYDPDQLSPKEAKERAQLFASFQDAIREEEQAADVSSSKVQEAVFNQLRKVGQGKREAKTNAILAASVMRTFGRRLNRSPEEFFAQFNQIVGRLKELPAAEKEKLLTQPAADFSRGRIEALNEKERQVLQATQGKDVLSREVEGVEPTEAATILNRLEKLGLVQVKEEEFKSSPTGPAKKRKRFRAIEAPQPKLEPGQQTFFAGGEGKLPRGFINLDDMAKVFVGILPGADKSTFMHEMGHFYLEILGMLAAQPNTPLSMKEDFQTVMSWLGVKDLKEWQNMDPGNRKVLHERWANGFVQFLSEGKAPTRRLESAFGRFAAWMKDLFKRIGGIDVGLTKEVREVMNRLVAVEEEIFVVEQSLGLEPITEDDAAIPGQNPAQLQKNQNAVDRARIESRLTLTRKIMESLRRGNQKAFEENVDAFRQETAALLAQEPDYKAWHNLMRGKTPDGKDVEAAFKLSRQLILEAPWGGEEKLKQIPPQMVTSNPETAMEPDFVARALEFSSGEALVNRMIELRESAENPDVATKEEEELKRELRNLQDQRAAMDLASTVKEDEKDALAKEVKGGKVRIRRKLEKALLEQERQETEYWKSILKLAKDRGGVKPAPGLEETAKGLVPKSLLRPGRGEKSDILAQAMFDNPGVPLDEPTSEALFNLLSVADEQVKASKARRRGLKEDAKRLAVTRFNKALEGIAKNANEQGKIQERLKQVALKVGEIKRQVTRDPFKVAVERVTQERANAEFGDILQNEEELREEAEKAVHNMDQAQVMHNDLKFLMTVELPAAQRLTKTIARRAATMKFYVSQAEQIVDVLPIIQIRPNLYKQQEARLATEALKLFQAGKIEEAFDAKELQLLNHNMYIVATKRLKQAQRDRQFMDRFNEKKIRAKIGQAGGEYLAQIDRIMEQYNFRKAVSERDINERHGTLEFLAARKEDGTPAQIPADVVNRAQKITWKELTPEQLKEVADSARNIEHLSKLKNTLLTGQERADFDRRIDDLRVSLILNAEGVTPTGHTSDGAEFTRVAAGIVAMHRKISSLVFRMDGLKMGGEFWGLFMRPLNEAGDNEATRTADVSKKLQKLFLDTYDRNFIKNEMYNKREVRTLGGSFSKMNLLMIALNWGNVGNREAMMEGHGWSESTILGVLNDESLLNDQDWDFVQGVWDLIQNEFWDDIKGLHKRVTGLEPDQVERAQVVLRRGKVLPGGYFPLRYDPNIVVRTKDAQGNEVIRTEAVTKTEAEEIIERAKTGLTFRSTTKHGHREQRNRHVGRPPKLDFSVIFQHMKEVLHDLTHYETLVDLNRVLRDSRVSNIILERYGKPVLTQFKEALRDIAAGELPAQTAFERGINYLRQGTSIAAMSWNLGVALLQPLGLTNSWARIGSKWLGRGIASWFRGGPNGQEKMVEWIQAKSKLMKNRSRTFMREINEVRNGLTRRGLTVGPVEDTYFYLITRMQMVADIPTWLGVYEREMDNGDPNAVPGSPAQNESAEDFDVREKRAIAIADQAVLDTQGGGQIKDLAAIQRGSPLLKIFTNFYGFFSATFNLQAEAFAKAKRDFSKNGGFAIGMLAVDLFLLWTLPATLSSLLRSLLKGEDDDIMGDIVAENMSYIMGGMVGLRDVGGFLRGFRYEGPAGLSAFSNVVNAAIQIKQFEADEPLIRSLWKTGGVFFHYPASQLDKTGWGLYYLFTGETRNPLVILGGPSRR